MERVVALGCGFNEYDDGIHAGTIDGDGVSGCSCR